MKKSAVPAKRDSLLTIDLQALDKNVEPAIGYLSSRLDEPLRAKQDRLRLRSVSARTAKLLLHKFLRYANIKGYRVVVVHPGLITVVKLTTKKKKPYEKPISFAVPMTIPEYQAAAAIGGSVPRPGERKWKP